MSKTNDVKMSAPASNLPAWLERTDLIRATIRITANDSADIFALPWAEIKALAGLDLANLKTDEAAKQTQEIVDRILTRAIDSWTLPDTARVYLGGEEPLAPRLLADAKERDALWARMPASLIMRLAEGVAAHSGNS